jgi:hypothetical protein
MGRPAVLSRHAPGRVRREAFPGRAHGRSANTPALRAIPSSAKTNSSQSAHCAPSPAPLRQVPDEPGPRRRQP